MTHVTELVTGEKLGPFRGNSAGQRSDKRLRYCKSCPDWGMLDSNLSLAEICLVLSSRTGLLAEFLRGHRQVDG